MVDKNHIICAVLIKLYIFRDLSDVNVESESYVLGYCGRILKFQSPIISLCIQGHGYKSNKGPLIILAISDFILIHNASKYGSVYLGKF